MAFEQSFKRGPSDVAITIRWAGRARSLRMSRWLGGVLLGLLPLLACWYLCATLYVVFHDPLLASLMARQTDMQYAYEDRIAALKTDLDRQTSLALIQRHTLDTTVRDLSERGVRLEARAATIDALVGGTSVMSASSLHPPLSDLPDAAAPDAALPSQPGVLDNATAPAAVGSPDRRLDRSMDSSALLTGDDRSVLPVSHTTDHLSRMLSQVEDRQNQVVARLRDPAIHAVERMQLALADTGLPRSRWQKSAAEEADIGGPYVPLPTSVGAPKFDRSVELVRDAVLRYRRLSEVIDHVPLHRPLAGRLEVTSTFGARVDPFLGRPAMHTGIDLHESYGDKVAATAAGIVTIAGPDGGYGNMVEIDHGDGLSTRYAHLSTITVSVHQHVKCGDLVGHVGMTGRTTGPHLHYETRINGEPVNPARFLKAGLVLFPG